MIDDRSSETDPLSQAIGLLKPSVFAWQVIEAHDAWAIRFPAVEAAVFGQVIEGGCRAELPNGARLDLEAGDFLLLVAPDTWRVHTDADAASVDLKTVLADPARLRTGGDDAIVTRFMAGAFLFASPDADLLAGVLRPVTHVRAAEVAEGRLGALLGLLGDEALAERPGRSLVLDRLLELILVESIRARPADAAGAGQGLLGGLADPQVAAALRLMHGAAQEPWTVGVLAQRVGMSRSAFAARFAQAVGAPPIDYLLTWRMSLARDALRASKKPMAEIAELAGYQSVSAFSTAFSRATGCSPSAYARGRERGSVQ